MKKIFLSGVVVFSFILYSLLQRIQFDDETSININSPITAPLPTVAIPTSGTAPPKTPTVSSGQYKDGTYTGDVADAYYGNIQVAAVVSNGRLSAVNILQYPNDRSRSIMINSQALPILQSEAIKSQNANVNAVSGASDTSQAFVISLQSALSKAL